MSETYFRIADSFVYITNIIDIYSRRCLGLVWGRTLEASTVIPAIKMAFKARKGQQLAQCIFHADYIDKNFLKLINNKNMELSRAESCYENPFIEKFHDIVKNHYLIPWKVDSVSRLDLALDRFIKLYNFHRPHGSLGGMAPAAFEAMALKMPEKKRKTMYVLLNNFDLSTPEVSTYFRPYQHSSVSLPSKVLNSGISCWVEGSGLEGKKFFHHSFCVRPSKSASFSVKTQFREKLDSR